MIWIIIASDTVAVAMLPLAILVLVQFPRSLSGLMVPTGEVDETLDPFCRCPRDPHLTGTARASLPRPRKRVAVSPCPGAGIAQN